MNTILLSFIEVLNGENKSHGLLRQGGLKDGHTLNDIIELRVIAAKSGADGFEDFPETGDWLFFDWNGKQLEPETPVCTINPPKIVLAYLFSGEPTENDLGILNFQIKNELENRADIKEFIASPEAQTKARPLLSVDVFLSHASKDKELAREICNELSALNVFLDEKNIGAGIKWEDAIRDNLRASRVGIILLTPNSINSSWVMAEAGAMWALEIPIFPFYQYVDLRKLPTLISNYQARSIATPSDFKSSCLEVIKSIQK